jgi:uncharacterized protein (DUF58 family)
MAGQLFSGALVAAAVFGIDTRQTLAYQLASVFFAMLLVAVLLSIRWRPELEIRRTLPEYVTNGEPTYYNLKIINHSRKYERDLVLHDILEQPWPDYHAFERAKTDPRNQARNWFDRSIGFPRWVELVRDRRGAVIEPVLLPPIPPGGEINLRLELLPLRRGHLNFSSATLYRPDPLGLCFAEHRIPARDHVISLPRRYPVPSVNLYSKRCYQHGGVNFAMAVGDAQEFISVRDYRPGDPQRHIHWRSFAKTGHPIVKQYQDEYFNRHALIVDTFLEDQPLELFEAVISLAASFSSIDRPDDSLLDVVFVGDRVWQLTAGRGLADTARILCFLAEASPIEEDGFERLRSFLRGHMSQLASIVIVFGHWDESRRELIDEFKQRQMPFWAVRVVAGGQDGAPVPDAETAAQYGVHMVELGRISEDLAGLKPHPGDHYQTHGDAA